MKSGFNHLLGAAIACLTLSTHLFATDTFEDRRAWLLDQIRDTTVSSGTAKQQMAIASGKLWETNGEDPESLAYVASASGDQDRFFRLLGQTRAFYLGREHFSEDQINELRNMARAMDDWNNTGTENHRLMIWTSGYLFAQAFPDQTYRWTENGRTSIISAQELMANLLELIITRGQWRYSGGNSEYLSPAYDMFSTAAMANLYDFAEDPEVRDVADAFLHYHVGNMALGSDEGYILSPFSRSADQSSRMNLSISQWIPWLYWGWNRPTGLDTEPPYVIYLATSTWRPGPLLDAIGLKEVEHPYTFRVQQAQFQRSPLRYVMRTTYRADNYSISSGVVRHIPAAFILDDTHFSLAYSTRDELRAIEAFHPYWRSASDGEDYWRGPTSPFQQSVQHENTVILLYDLPEKDPWAGVGQWASARSEDIIQMAQVRIPKAMAEQVTDHGDWYFYREDEVYVGIRVLQPGSVYETSLDVDANYLFMYNVIKSYAPQTGFIFEVGNEAEYGSFEAFQNQLLDNPLTIDWETLTVTYTNSRGNELAIEYNTSLETPDGSVPSAWINGQMINHEKWPFMESPYINVSERIMTIEVNGDWKVIDWSEEFPAISEGSGTVVPRLTMPYFAFGEYEENFMYQPQTLHPANSFAAEGLPEGLSIDPVSGGISGTPEEVGTFDVLIEATNAAGTSRELLTIVLDGEVPITLETYFPGGSFGEGGLYTSPVLGDMMVGERGLPFIDLVDHGLWWVAGDFDFSMYVYDFGLNSWLYTSSIFYPYFYQFDPVEPRYIWYLEEKSRADDTGRWFFSYGPTTTGEFFVPFP